MQNLAAMLCCKNFYRFGMPWVVLLLLVGGGYHLAFGSCQTSRLHYIVQAYYLPFRKTRRSLDFTGCWRRWHRSGHLMETADYHLGAKHGARRIFDESGAMIFETHYRNGVLHGRYYGKVLTDDIGSFMPKAPQTVWYYNSRPVTEAEFARLTAVEKE